MPCYKWRPLKSALALTALMFSGFVRPTLAADWGYDDMPEAHHLDSAAPSPNGVKGQPSRGHINPKMQQASGRKGKKAVGHSQTRTSSETSAKSGGESAGESGGETADQIQSQPMAGQPQTNETSLTPQKADPTLRGPSPDEIAARKKVEDLKSWMEIFALAASSASEDDRNQILSLGTLAQGTKKKLEKIAFEKLEQNVPEYLGVSSIWRPLSQKVTEDIDYKESYRLLFRSLLRHAVGRIEPTAPEAEAIQEVLGPARIAEMGPPILTEDAINAYSDMTCFLYQVRHPDHTVEGDDNRQMFAEVIRQKYNDAPNIEAKKAMCNFDLTWASFRCRYLDSNAAGKDKLIASISGGKTETTAMSAANTSAATGTKTAAGAKGKSQSSIALMSPKLLKIFALGPWAESSKTIPVAVKMSQMSEPTK